MSFLKTGVASQKIAEQEKVQAEIRKEEQGKMFRFFIKEGDEARITFVDGDLSPEGFLTPPRFFEHQLQMNGNWNNLFVCPEQSNPGSGEKCPICQGGDKPSLVALFTIIDHRSFTSRDGSKTFKDMPRLFVAKPSTMEILSKHAIKRGGLAGSTWDVSRAGDRSPAAGNMFDFVAKTPIEELKKVYTREHVDPKTKAKSMKCFFVPADYETEITYRSGEELAAMGLGAPSNIQGPKTTSAALPASPGGNMPKPSSENYDDTLL